MRARGAGCPAGLLAVGWLILVGLQASQASNVTSSGGGVQEPAVAREGESESESESEEEAENEGEVPESETTAEADAEEEGEGSGSLGTEAPKEARSPSFCRKELPVPSSVEFSGIHIRPMFTHFVHFKACKNKVLMPKALGK